MSVPWTTLRSTSARVIILRSKPRTRVHRPTQDDGALRLEPADAVEGVDDGQGRPLEEQLPREQRAAQRALGQQGPGSGPLIHARAA